MGLEVAPDIGGTPAAELVVVAARPNASRVTVRDASSGALISSARLSGTDLVDIALIPDLGGEPGPEVVILGIAMSTVLATVVDTASGAVLATFQLCRRPLAVGSLGDGRWGRRPAGCARHPVR